LTAELAEMTRQVSEARTMIPHILPARTQDDGTVCQPLVAGVLLEPVRRSFWRGELRQVLFSVAAPVRRGRAAGVKTP
jgi:hypothetical protein